MLLPIVPVNPKFFTCLMKSITGHAAKLSDSVKVIGCCSERRRHAGISKYTSLYFAMGGGWPWSWWMGASICSQTKSTASLGRSGAKPAFDGITCAHCCFDVVGNGLSVKRDYLRWITDIRRVSRKIVWGDVDINLFLRCQF